MSLMQALIGARINETLDNYVRADQLLAARPGMETTPSPDTVEYGSDNTFWNAIFADKQRYVNQLFNLRKLKISEWVPRVPGLAHKPESRKLPQLTTQWDKEVKWEKLTDGTNVYQPQVSSEHILSGVGTLRLPPNANGEYLFSASSTGEASEGVPILINHDVWDRIQKNNLCEGRMITCTARWQPMAMEWSTYFRSTGDIPPGYFVLYGPNAIDVEDTVERTWVYPFTIMEYESKSSELFDYVYCGARTDNPDFRHWIERFFEQYRLQFGGVHSRFLIAGDMVDGLWSADFNSPAELLAQGSSTRSQLTLLQERVKDHMLGKTVIDELLVKMQRVISGADLMRLSSEVFIDSRIWQVSSTTLAEQCSQFLAAVVTEGKQDALMERLGAQMPYVF